MQYGKEENEITIDVIDIFKIIFSISLGGVFLYVSLYKMC